MNRNPEEILTRRSKLSPAKRALLEKRLRGKVEPNSRLEDVIPRRSSNTPAPLSFAQQRLWFLHELYPDNPSYNEHGEIQLTGSIDMAAMERSLNEIVRRHESLRATFEVVEGQPLQVIAPRLTFTLPVVNLCELPEPEQKREVQRLATEQSQQPFDLVRGPLLRWMLLQLSQQEYVLLFTVHHIVFDGWSIGVLFREIATLYEAFSTGKPSPLPELPIQYADFAAWQRQWLQGEVLDAQLAYWKQQLKNLPTLQFPTDRPRPAVQTFRGARRYFVLPKVLSENIKLLSQQENVTLFMTLLATFKILLHYYTKQDDIVIGTDVANRNRVEIEGLIGFFVNQLVLRTNLSENPTFRELLGRVRDVTADAYAHQDLPFEKLVEVLNPERTLSRQPLFQVKFVLQNTPVAPLELSNLTVKALDDMTPGRARFDLFLVMEDTERGLKGLLDCDTDLFDASRMARILRHFETLLTTVVTHPESQLNSLTEILAEADKQQRLLNKTKRKEAYLQKFKAVRRNALAFVQDAESED